ncbi:hypothetical protein J7438_07645 [Thalassotalea sp. G20_0]|uniref:Flp family type IVb pilin n=1 Tax=Thalassotalea sp. G20_0 TaxID=2821093 RepID=UPI001ADB9688|nr:hypothetical protein [Thalassotalea sp. G20_0]MBO9493959.1 hypothetical protein [Thalassotalea sp. G20_0]
MIRQLIRDFLKEEDGLAAVEYAVLVAAIVAGATAFTSQFSGNDGIFASIASQIKTQINKLTS